MSDLSMLGFSPQCQSTVLGGGHCWEGVWTPETPGGVSASKAFGSYFAKVVGKGYAEEVRCHSFYMWFPTEIPNHLIALRDH